MIRSYPTESARPGTSGSVLLLMTVIICSALPVLASGQNLPWAAVMGQSGLRRFYSTGGDLGELVNRQLSYRIASRTGQAESDVNGYVLQWDSLVPVSTAPAPAFLVRGLARIAHRFEEAKVDGRNDRYDLALVYAPTRRSYISAGVAYEHTRANLEFVSGTASGGAVGPRIDGGIVFSNTLAWGTRVEQLEFDGDTQVSLTTPGGVLEVDRDVEYRRRFLKTELMARYGRAQLSFLPARMQLGWMSGIQYLETRYQPKIDSRGQPAVEPFGNRERLGIVRGGVFSSVAFGSRSNWNATLELMFDREFDTNLNDPIDDRTTRYVRAGLGYVLGPGKRIQLDYQDFRSLNGLRTRNNFTVIGVMDF